MTALSMIEGRIEIPVVCSALVQEATARAGAVPRIVDAFEAEGALAPRRFRGTPSPKLGRKALAGSFVRAIRPRLKRANILGQTAG